MQHCTCIVQIRVWRQYCKLWRSKITCEGNYTYCKLWNHFTSKRVFIPILMHVCQCLQISSLCILSISCHARLIYYKDNVSPREETDMSCEENERRILTWPCPSLWLLLLGCTTGCHLRACGGTQSKWRKKSHDREKGMNRGREKWETERLVGGKGRDRVKKNGIKKNKVVVVAIKNFYAQWVQSSLWGVPNELRAASNEIPIENRGVIQTDS